MPWRIDRRQFLKAAAITSGAIGVGIAWPKGHQNTARASATHWCYVGGNRNFVTTEEPNLGMTVSTERFYSFWGEEIFAPNVVESADLGRRLILSMFPADRTLTTVRRWDDIAAGKYDADIKDMAAQLKAFAATHPRRVGLAFNHEPEDDRDASTGTIHLGNEADFRAAFAHFFSVLKGQGAKNFYRTMVLMGSTFRSEADSYWPGSSNVDRIGVDCYNWFGSVQRPDAQWKSFQEIVQPAYDYAAAKDRRLWVCETGTLEDPNDGQRKATWFSDMQATLKTMPLIKAVSYFEGGQNGWWLADAPQGSPAALAAFQALLEDPYFV